MTVRRRGQGAGQRLVRPAQDGRQVDGVAPGVSLLAPRRGTQLAHRAGQHFPGVLPADVVQQFRGLVDEIRDVAAVQEHVVRGGGHHHVDEQRGFAVHGNGGEQAPRGAVRIAHLHEAAEPALQLLDRQIFGIQRLQVEPRRFSVAVAGHVRQPLVEGEDLLVLRQVCAQVGHGGQDGQARPPSGRPVPHPVPAAGLGDILVGHARFQQGDHGLGVHQRDVLLQALPEAVAPVFRVAGAVPRTRHPHVAVPYLHREYRHVVGKEVEGAAALQVEVRVMPVAGQDAVLDRPPVQRETHVGTAVVHGVHLSVVVVEHGNGSVVSADDDVPLFLEFVHRSDPDRVAQRCTNRVGHDRILVMRICFDRAFIIYNMSTHFMGFVIHYSCRTGRNSVAEPTSFQPSWRLRSKARAPSNKPSERP